MEKTDILVINPGSTTTKIGLFRNAELVFEETLTHDPDKLLAYSSLTGQKLSEKFWTKKTTIPLC